jgi:hypothetical protein
VTPFIRDVNEEDLKTYVLHAWARASHGIMKSSCYRLQQQSAAPLLTMYETLFRSHQKRILARARCIVALNPDDHDQRMGYLIYEPTTPPIVHFAQVKQDFWRMGVAKALLAHAEIDRTQHAIYTFMCHFGRVIPKGWVYVPYQLHPEFSK